MGPGAQLVQGLGRSLEALPPKLKRCSAREAAAAPRTEQGVAAASMRSLSVSGVTIEGFKGYRVAHTVGPFSPSFAVIVGANGLGKSTVVEALSWVISGAAAHASAASAPVVARGAERACVTVHFRIDGDARLDIRRTSAHGSRRGSVTTRYGHDETAPWQTVSSVELVQLLSAHGLNAARADSFYLSQGSSTRMFELAPPDLFFALELALAPGPRAAAHARADELALARAEADEGREEAKAAQAALIELSPLAEQAQRALAKRERLADECTKAAADARGAHAALLCGLEKNVASARVEAERAATRAEEGKRAHARAREAHAAARGAHVELENALAEARGASRAANAAVASARSALGTAERRREAEAEARALETKREAERAANIASLDDELRRVRAARDDASARVRAFLSEQPQPNPQQPQQPQPKAGRAHSVRAADADDGLADAPLSTPVEPPTPSMREPPSGARTADQATLCARREAAAGAAAEVRALRSRLAAAELAAVEADDRLERAREQARSSREQLAEHDAALAQEAAHRPEPGALSAADSARCTVVHALARSGAARGVQVHGFAAELIWLEDESAGVAAQAALGSQLARTVVVETRADAEALVSALRDARASVTTCMLRSELERAAANASGASAPTAPPAGCKRLSDLLGCEPSMRAVVDKLAGGWLVAPDASSAELYSVERGARAVGDRADAPATGASALRRNVVSLDGCVYLAHGEMRTTTASADAPSPAGGARRPLWCTLTTRGPRHGRAATPRAAKGDDDAAQREALDALGAARRTADTDSQRAAARAALVARVDAREAHAADAEVARERARAELRALEARAAEASEREQAAAALARTLEEACARGEEEAADGVEGATADPRARSARGEHHAADGASTNGSAARAPLEAARKDLRDAEAKLATLGYKRKRALAASSSLKQHAKRNTQVLARSRAQLSASAATEAHEEDDEPQGAADVADKAASSDAAVDVLRDALAASVAVRDATSARSRAKAKAVRDSATLVSSRETEAAAANRALAELKLASERARAAVAAADRRVRTVREQLHELAEIERSQAAKRADKTEPSTDADGDHKRDAGCRSPAAPRTMEPQEAAAEEATAAFTSAGRRDRVAHARSARRRRGAVIMSDDSESEDSDFTAADRAPGPRPQRASLASGTDDEASDEDPGEDEADDDAIALARRSDHASAPPSTAEVTVDALAARADRLRAAVSAAAARAAALDRELASLAANERLRGLPQAVRELQEARTRAVSHAARAEQLAEELAELQLRRHAAFEAALVAVNGQLSKRFGALCAGADAAFEPAGGGASTEALETEGVRLVARVRGQPWRPWSNLSGGQQQLLALVAHVALGESTSPPAPLLLLDEVDSALDSRNVASVGQLLHALRGAPQCICVSLRPQLIERAMSLTGVYTLGGSARTVTYFLEQEGALLSGPDDSVLASMEEDADDVDGDTEGPSAPAPAAQPPATGAHNHHQHGLPLLPQQHCQ